MSGQDKLQIPPKLLSIPVAVVFERRELDHPWMDAQWRACGLLLDPPPGVHGRERLREGPRTEYLAACDPLELHAKDVEGYLVNLAMEAPRVWIVSDLDHDDPEDPLPVKPLLATVSAYEAQEYLDPGEMAVDVVPMPEELLAALTRFCAAQPRPAPFRKRKNKRLDAEEYRFGKEPLDVLRRRMGKAGEGEAK